MSQEYTEDKDVTLTKLSSGRRLLEALLILIALFAVWLMAALLSFNPSDPSWSQTAWHEPIHNLGGIPGAWLADRAIAASTAALRGSTGSAVSVTASCSSLRALARAIAASTAALRGSVPVLLPSLCGGFSLREARACALRASRAAITALLSGFSPA
ncbi:DNA translocase FtsK 4TM domain-containing protein [Citrobacter portucalensis]|uniref:DNA translocase FtsK 4TM domain-containing protein n=1 Tax=Citrobacter portucalensis TaxID=1639133 RepID=UPI003C12B6AC